jgi:ribA/ribD-fused uncharacterized protein
MYQHPQLDDSPLSAPAFLQREYSVSPASPTSSEPIYKVVEKRRTVYISSNVPLSDKGQWKEELANIFGRESELDEIANPHVAAREQPTNLRIVCDPESLRPPRPSRRDHAASRRSCYLAPSSSSSMKLTKRSPVRGKLYFYDRNKPFYGFTNFSHHNVNYHGCLYPTSEHLFQSLKFIPHRPDIAEHIRACPRPSAALSEARRHKEHQRPDWFHVNIQMMDEVLRLKFSQHPELKAELLSTGDLELIEDSDKDSFWGIGKDGQGQNELGKGLERLREKFRRGLA